MKIINTQKKKMAQEWKSMEKKKWKKKDGLLFYGFLIVAMAAGEDLITTWGAKLASSFVMFASRNPKTISIKQFKQGKKSEFHHVGEFLKIPMFHFPEMIALICRSIHGLQERMSEEEQCGL